MNSVEEDDIGELMWDPLGDLEVTWMAFGLCWEWIGWRSEEEDVGTDLWIHTEMDLERDFWGSDNMVCFAVSSVNIDVQYTDVSLGLLI